MFPVLRGTTFIKEQVWLRMKKVNNYLLTENEAFTVKSQTETFPCSDSVALCLQARIWPVGITGDYKMACVCRRHNARSDWLIATELHVGHYSPEMPTSRLRTCKNKAKSN